MRIQNVRFPFGLSCLLPLLLFTFGFRAVKLQIVIFIFLFAWRLLMFTFLILAGPSSFMPILAWCSFIIFWW